MRKTIEVNGRYRLCYAYDCETNEEFYDVYRVGPGIDDWWNCLGELSVADVADNEYDDGTYDEDGLEVLCDDLI